MKKTISTFLVLSFLLNICTSSAQERNRVKQSSTPRLYNIGQDQNPDPFFALNRISAPKKEKGYFEVEQQKEDGSSRTLAVFGSDTTNQITLLTDFEGNGWNGGTPPDNDIAISKDGYIVSVVNSSIRIFDTTGTILRTRSLSNFGKDVIGLGTGDARAFDPRVLYDPLHDRFIIVFLYGSTSSESKVVVGFSRFQDPTDDWFVYDYAGNYPVQGYNTWFDFPTVGINNNSLFIGGNLFTDEDQAVGPLIFQIDLADGYSGRATDYRAWEQVSNAEGWPGFTIYPLSSGLEESYGPHMNLVSTYSSFGGAEELVVYTISDSVNGTPKVSAQHYEVDRYRATGDADQLNSSEGIGVGDMRMQDGFILNDVIHCVFTSRYSSGYSGVNYSKINLGDETTHTTMIGQVGRDLAFPSISFAGCNDTDKVVAISYLTSHAGIYPSAEFVVVSEDSFVTDPIILKEGEGPVDVMEGTDRWGDYSGTFRWYGQDKPTFASGICYGTEDQYLGTWIGVTEIEKSCSTFNTIEQYRPKVEFKAYPNPVVDMINIEFEIANSQLIEVELLNLEGKKLASFMKERAKAGKSQFTFNLNFLPVGSYMIAIKDISNKILATKKIIVQP